MTEFGGYAGQLRDVLFLDQLMRLPKCGEWMRSFQMEVQTFFLFRAVVH